MYVNLNKNWLFGKFDIDLWGSFDFRLFIIMPDFLLGRFTGSSAIESRNICRWRNRGGAWP